MKQDRPQYCDHSLSRMPLSLLWGMVALVVIGLTNDSRIFAMAVDRTKFRTCQQTSFCRRHRNGRSARLYDYQLLADSIQLHLPPQHSDQQQRAGGQDGKKEGDAGESKNVEKDKSVWSSISRRLLGKKSQEAGASSSVAAVSEDDLYVRGTPPTLTGIIINTAKETSTGSTKEQLQFALYAMQNGIARMRITEIYGASGSAYQTARVTYDDLVLYDAEQWKEATFVQLLRHSSSAGDGSKETDQLLERLVSMVPSATKAKAILSNFMALEFGDKSGDVDVEASTILLMQLKPFSVWLFRGGNLDAGPVIAVNEESLMNFEIRRFKDTVGEEPQAEEKEEEKKEGEDGTSEKTIVGYWEDGLAIYSDGTREEKKKVDEEDEHRKLSEDSDGLDRDGMWEESFGSHRDSKPYGPMSVGIDVRFPQSKHLYGLPEHASAAVLQDTFSYYKEPYRLYNLDVFEYEIDEPMALYGAIPLIVSQSAVTGTSGLFWFNPSETFVDVRRPNEQEKKQDTTTSTHWMSESGVMDVFFLSGGSPASLMQQYTLLTGTPPLPPMFALGYHQCRWNYKDEKDVYTVHSKFEEYDFPYDMIWLDIEHTDGKKYFTWDPKLFPNPTKMQETLWAQGRRMVTIVDPHIKRDNDWSIHKEATAKGFYTKDKNGDKDFDGWCWPGSSSYLDFTQANVREWWADLFSYSKYKGSTPSLFTWNDMNEPSVFNGPEVSMSKDLRNLEGHEHREWHNLYGMLQHRATFEGLVARSNQGEMRPFVLSRSFFAGSQKYSAIWTGDNTADWKHLEIASPMLLSLNVAAMSFVGADVGGFFGSPDAQLFTRWMQAAAYQPFYRGHAHHDSKRREPWVFDEVTLTRTRRASMVRYALLPMWYTLFREAELAGLPVMRFMWMHYPDIPSLYSVDLQYLIGADLLVHPVVAPDISQVDLLFPAQDVWYNADTLERVKLVGERSDDGVIRQTWSVDMDSIPVFQRGGSILVRKLWLRRSSELMKSDPYTLFVALDQSFKAQGRLYMDDEDTHAYLTKDDHAMAHFSTELSSSSGRMTNTVERGTGWDEKNFKTTFGMRMIERIVIAGMPERPTEISVKDDSTATPLEFDYDDAIQLLVVRKPLLSAAQDWTIKFLL